MRNYSTTPIDLSSATVVVTLAAPNANLCASTSTASNLNSINVKVTLNFQVATPLIGAFIGQSIPISANVSSYILTPQC